MSLAVRLGHGHSAQVPPKDEEPPLEKDEEDGLDEFLSAHGFEYVDGDRGGRRPTRDGESFDDEDSAGAYPCRRALVH